MIIDWDKARVMYEDEFHGISYIAKKFDTHATTIQRGFKKLGIPIRSKSESQKLALEKGYNKHPTSGKVHNTETRERIGRASKRTWDNMEDSDKEKRAKDSKTRWDNRTEEMKEEMSKKSAAALRIASKEGSKLEKFLMYKIREVGWNVEWHLKPLENENLEVDLYLPDHYTAVEVDGIFHFGAVFSDEQYQKQVTSDAEKNGLLLKNGLCVIRLRNTKKNVSQVYFEQVWEELKKVLVGIQKKRPPQSERLIHLEVK